MQCPDPSAFGGLRARTPIAGPDRRVWLDLPTDPELPSLPHLHGSARDWKVLRSVPHRRLTPWHELVSGPAPIVKIKRPDRAADAGHRLRDQRPVALAPVLCRGDFALEQILFGPDGLALVDFDRRYAGEAAADLGRFLVLLAEAPPPGMTASQARAAYLAGHAEVQGETDGNRLYYVGRKDVPLNATGRAQAYALAGQLSGLPVRAILTRPLSCAWQTAQPLAGHLGLPMSVDAALIKFDFGALALVGHYWSNRMLWGVLSGLLQHRSYAPETGSGTSIPMPTW